MLELSEDFTVPTFAHKIVMQYRILAFSCDVFFMNAFRY